MNYKIRGAKTRKVYERIKNAGKPISIAEIRKTTDVNYNTIRGAVQRLLKMGLIRRVSRGVYEA